MSTPDVALSRTTPPRRGRGRRSGDTTLRGDRRPGALDPRTSNTRSNSHDDQ
jgi:hypothetical protein